MHHRKSYGIKHLLLLQGVLLVNSVCGIFTKMAASYPAFSITWILLYGLGLFFLGAYALLWQQILKKVPLIVAFCNKAVTILWGMIFGAILFQEQITWKMVIGAVVVLTGVIMVVTADE